MLAKWTARITEPFRRSIRSRIMLTMVLLAVLPIITVTLLAAENSRTSMEEEVIGTNRSNMKWTGLYLGEQFSQLNNLIYSMLISPTLSDYMAMSEDTPLSAQFAAQRDVINTVTNLYYSAGNHVVGVDLYLKEQGKMFTIDASQSDIRTEGGIPAIFKELFDNNEDYRIQQDPSDPGRFQLIRSINRFENRAKLGAVSLAIRWGVFDQTLNLLGHDDQQTVLIADHLGNPLYQPHGSRPAEETLRRVGEAGNLEGYFRSGGDYVFYQTIDPVGLKLITVIPGSFINRSALDTMRFGLIVGLISALIGVLAAALLAWRMAAPIVRLARSIKGFDLMKQRKAPAVRRIDEIGFLEMKLYQMSERIRDHVQNEYVIGLEKKSAELKALQAQINPHFLQNTLQMIGSMLFKHSPAESYEVLRSLSDMFRYIIREPDDLATLRAELGHLNNYMQIQRQRFGPRLTYRTHIDGEVLMSPIPKLTLQPIVENAFVHGFEPKQGPWELELDIRRRGGEVLIRITDNGAGMPEGKLAELRRGLGIGSRTWQERGARVGLHNVSDRILLHFGENYGLRIQSIPGGGTTVLVAIPYERSGEHLD